MVVEVYILIWVSQSVNSTTVEPLIKGSPRRGWPLEKTVYNYVCPLLGGSTVTVAGLLSLLLNVCVCVCVCF